MIRPRKSRGDPSLESSEMSFSRVVKSPKKSSPKKTIIMELGHQLVDKLINLLKLKTFNISNFINDHNL